MREEEGLDEEGKPKATGIGFVELRDEDAALFLVRKLNNVETNKKLKKGLILEFSMEDHRKL